MLTCDASIIVGLPSEVSPVSESIQRKDRKATRLANEVVELTALTAGGHLADFRFLEHDERPSLNVFWEAPWVTRDAVPEAAENLPSTYGPLGERKFIAGFTGHAICVDYFGGPSPAQAAAGLSLHGEAANSWWQVNPSAQGEEAACSWQVNLPSAGLAFERSIRLGRGESVAYVTETITNQRDQEHAFDWVQHVTFGDPLLRTGESTLLASAHRGMGWPLDYDGPSMLAKDPDFVWPYAPRADGSGFADLRLAFAEKGKGFIAGLQLDPRRDTEYILAVNWRLRLGVGYCFLRKDFPWMTVWEENCARPLTPWNAETQARGMEFGTAPLPLGREETMRRGAIFDTPTQCVLPSGGKKTAPWLLFLFVLPAGVDTIRDVAVAGDAIVLYDQDSRECVSIPAVGSEEFLTRGRR